MPDGRRSTPRLPSPETLREQVVTEEHDLAPDGSFAVLTRRAVEGERCSNVDESWENLAAVVTCGRAFSQD